MLVLESPVAELLTSDPDVPPTPALLPVDPPPPVNSWAPVAEQAAKVVCGDPFDPASDQGPQCNRPQFEKILKYIELGRREGARLRAGGGPDLEGRNAPADAQLEAKILRIAIGIPQDKDVESVASETAKKLGLRPLDAD